MGKSRTLALGALLVLLRPSPVLADGDFSITANPATINVRQGEKGSSILSTVALNGFNADIKIDGLGGDETGDYVAVSDGKVPAPGTGGVFVEVNCFNKPIGQYQRTLKASGGGVSKSVTLTINVTPSTYTGTFFCPNGYTCGSGSVTYSIPATFETGGTLKVSGSPIQTVGKDLDNKNGLIGVETPVDIKMEAKGITVTFPGDDGTKSREPYKLELTLTNRNGVRSSPPLPPSQICEKKFTKEGVKAGASATFDETQTCTWNQLGLYITGSSLPISFAQSRAYLKVTDKNGSTYRGASGTLFDFQMADVPTVYQFIPKVDWVRIMYSTFPLPGTPIKGGAPNTFRFGGEWFLGTKPTAELIVRFFDQDGALLYASPPQVKTGDFDYHSWLVEPPPFTPPDTATRIDVKAALFGNTSTPLAESLVVSYPVSGLLAGNIERKTAKGVFALPDVPVKIYEVKADGSATEVASTQAKYSEFPQPTATYSFKGLSSSKRYQIRARLQDAPEESSSKVMVCDHGNGNTAFELRWKPFTPGTDGTHDLNVDPSTELESVYVGTRSLPISKGVAAAEIYWRTWLMVHKMYPELVGTQLSLPTLPLEIYLDAVKGTDGKFPDAHYCVNDAGDCPTPGAIVLNSEDSKPGVNASTLWHEFGHHAIRELYRGEIPRPDGAVGGQLNRNHNGYANNFSSASIDEGFATFWAAAASLLYERDALGPFAALGIFRWSDPNTKPIALEDNYLVDEIRKQPNTPAGAKYPAVGEEEAIGGVLWDLIDAPFSGVVEKETPRGSNVEFTDAITLPLDVVVKFFAETKPSTILDIYQQLKVKFPSLAAGDPPTKLDQLFLLHGIFHDNGDSIWQPTEEIGRAANDTPWTGWIYNETSDLVEYTAPARPTRRNLPQLPDAYLDVTLKSESGAEVPDGAIAQVDLVFQGVEGLNRTEMVPVASGKVYFQMPPQHYQVEAKISIPGSPEPPVVVTNDMFWSKVGVSSTPGTPFMAATFVVPDPGPRVEGLTPGGGGPGDAVILRGGGFKADLAANVVTFGTERAIVTSAENGQLGVLVPTTLPAGTVDVVVTVGEKSSAPVAFTVAAPRLDLGGTASLAFGNVAVGATSDRTVTVRNAGTAPMKLLALAATGGRFSIVSPGPVSIPVGGTQAVTVRFSPLAAGAQSGSLIVSTSDPTHRSASVSLSGTGGGSGPDIALDGESLDFGSGPVGTPITLTVSVSNPGSSALTVTSVTGNPSAFGLSSPSVPFTIAAGGQQALTLRFTPSAAGAATGTLTLASNAGSRPSVVLSARGAGTSASGNPETLTADDGTVEFAYIADGFTIVNRLTPTTYPSKLTTIRLYLTPILNQPNPSGRTINLVAYLDPTGVAGSPQSPQLVLNQAVTIPSISGGVFVDYPIANGPTIVSGDLYVGYRAPTPAAGVGFPYDQSGTQYQRSWFSTDGGATFVGPLVFIDQQTQAQTKVNMMIRAVVTPTGSTGCKYALGPGAASLGSGAGAGSLTVTAPAGCAWSAASDQPWLALTQTQGSGNGTIGYSYQSNPGAATRTAKVTLGNLSSTLTQQGGEPVRDVLVPIVLSTPGKSGSFFTSELTLTNRGTTSAVVELAYRAASGGGSGAGLDVLPPGGQITVPDAISYLRSVGVPIPDSGGRVGTLRVRFRGLSSPNAGAAIARTATPVPEGRAGLAYGGVPSSAGLTGPVYLAGLRQSAADRSNVAVMNMGKDGDGDVQLRLTVYSGDPAKPASKVLPDIGLGPGGFQQISGILQSNGLDLSNGYVRVERVGGTAPYYAYGVINDEANSDGSFVQPFLESSLAGRTALTLPVAVEVGVFSSDLVVTNWSPSSKTVRFEYVADGFTTGDKTARFSVTARAGEQVLIPALGAYLRAQGIAGVPAEGTALVGAVFATVDSGDVSGLFVGSRTSSAGGGGRYGLFYAAVPKGLAATTSAWIFGLKQDGLDRSNLALVNTGEADGSTDGLRIEIFDGVTGQLVKSVDASLGPRKWTQLTAFLAQYAPGTANAYVHVTRIAGNNPFIVYGVVNDGGQPGQRSGDGAFVPMEVVE